MALTTVIGWTEVRSASTIEIDPFLPFRCTKIQNLAWGAQSMHPTLKAAFDAELESAERALANDSLAEAFAHLERAHVLGQWYVKPHVVTHLRMLRIGWRRRDLREILGQLIRIPGGMIGSAIGRVPRGNTGGSNVSAIRPLPIPPDLKDLLMHDRRSRLD